MTRTEFSLAYANRTDAELQTFIQNRNLNVAWTSRKVGIRLLRAVDQSTTFRFLDLPAELRNVIYTELLTLHKKGGNSQRKYCQLPALLSTCKQIYGEASEVLYANDEITVTIEVYQQTIWHRTDSRRMGAVALVNGRTVHLLDNSLDWPAYLRSLRKVKLSLRLSVFAQRSPDRILGSLTRANHTLFDLYEFLCAEDIELRELQVDTESELIVDDDLLAGMPFSIIAIGAKVPICGFIFRNISDPVATNLESSTRTLRTLLDRHAERQLYQELNRNFLLNHDRQPDVMHIDNMIVPVQRFDRLFAIPVNFELIAAVQMIEKELARADIDDYEGSIQEVIGIWEQLKVKKASREADNERRIEMTE